jgi:hypothetical protein
MSPLANTGDYRTGRLRLRSDFADDLVHQIERKRDRDVPRLVVLTDHQGSITVKRSSRGPERPPTSPAAMLRRWLQSAEPALREPQA